MSDLKAADVTTLDQARVSYHQSSHREYGEAIMIRSLDVIVQAVVLVGRFRLIPLGTSLEWTALQGKQW